MRLDAVQPPRVIKVGVGGGIEIKDCGRLFLDPDELVTLVTERGGEYDVVRKDWGFYATPSMNARLRDFNLRSVLIVNKQGRVFLLLVEGGKESGFDDYMEAEELDLVAWMDTDEAVDKLTRAMGPSRASVPSSRTCLCGESRFTDVFIYDSPPAGEVRYRPVSGTRYRRKIQRCEVCGHFISVQDAPLGSLYLEDYVDASYGPSGIATEFERIMNLPPDLSDNAGRVQSILRFASRFPLEPPAAGPRVLDIGSGLGVFPARIKEAGWRCTALDPDPRAVEHLRSLVGVPTVQAEFPEVDLTDHGPFDVITFNKVLEHVADPIGMLAASRKLLRKHCFVYVEVPDGSTAALEGREREEFFIEHLHVFSAASLDLLADKAGFVPLLIERLREPSGKFTLRGFLIPKPEASARSE